MKQIKINTRYSTYTFYTGVNTLKELPGLIIKKKLSGNLLVVIDGNVNIHHGRKIRAVFRNKSFRVVYYILKPGEASKSLKEISSIYSVLAENNFGRDSLIISIGGGVTGDVAGFAAATYMRGIKLVHIPTTIISAVDSSVGGKTGINFKGIKNIIGSFHHPEFILTDLKLVSTLPEKEINSGVGEITKYAFLTSKEFYNYVYKNLEKIYSLNHKVLQKIITTSVNFKSAVVESDEKERGLRKILNFGHTFAHAFESSTKFRIKHGEAVAAGIIAALFLSNRIGLLDDQELNELLKLPLRVKLNSKINFENYRQIINYMHSDKKSSKGKINFVLLSDIGRIVTDAEVSESDIIYALKKTGNITGN